MQFFTEPSAVYDGSWNNHTERMLDLFFNRDSRCSSEANYVREIAGKFAMGNGSLIEFNRDAITGETGTRVVDKFLRSTLALKLYDIVVLRPFARGLSLNNGDEGQLWESIKLYCSSDNYEEMVTMILCWYLVGCHDDAIDIWEGLAEGDDDEAMPEGPDGPAAQGGDAAVGAQIPAEDAETFRRAANDGRRRAEAAEAEVGTLRVRLEALENLETEANASFGNILQRMEALENVERSLNLSTEELFRLRARVAELESARPPASAPADAGNPGLEAAREELVTAQARVAALQHQLDTLRRQYTNVEQQRDGYKGRVTTTEEQRDRYAARIRELSTERDAARGRERQAKEEATGLRGEIVTKERQCLALEGKVSALKEGYRSAELNAESAKAELEAERDRIQARVSAVEGELKVAQERIKQVGDERESVNTEKSNLEKELNLLRSNASDLERKLEEAVRVNEAMKQASKAGDDPGLAAAKQEVANLTQSFTDAKKALQDKQTDFDRLLGVVQSNDETIAAQKTRLAELTAELATAASDLEKANEKVRSARRSEDEMNEKMENFLKEAEGGLDNLGVSFSAVISRYVQQNISLTERCKYLLDRSINDSQLVTEFAYMITDLKVRSLQVGNKLETLLREFNQIGLPKPLFHYSEPDMETSPVCGQSIFDTFFILADHFGLDHDGSLAAFEPCRSFVMFRDIDPDGETMRDLWDKSTALPKPDPRPSTFSKVLFDDMEPILKLFSEKHQELLNGTVGFAFYIWLYCIRMDETPLDNASQLLNSFQYLLRNPGIFSVHSKVVKLFAVNRGYVQMFNEIWQDEELVNRDRAHNFLVEYGDKMTEIYETTCLMETDSSHVLGDSAASGS